MRQDWIEINFGDLCDQIKPGYPTGKHNSEGDGYLHFRPYNIDSTGRINLSLAKHVELKSEDYFLRKGDIIFNNTNSPELLGKTCHINESQNWVYSNHMTRVRVKPFLDSKFYAIYLHYLFYRGFYKLHCSNHVNQASISSSFLGKHLVAPLAPLPEQRAIVAKIEQLFSALDNGIANLKAAKAKLDIYRQAVLKKAFEGEYDMVKVSDIAHVNTGSTPKRGKSEYWENGTVPWVTSGVVNNAFVDTADEYITEHALKETNCKIIEKGALLVAMYGEGKTRGKCSELKIDAATNQALAAITLKEEYKNSKDFVKWFFIKNYGRCIKCKAAALS